VLAHLAAGREPRVLIRAVHLHAQQPRPWADCFRAQVSQS
jgi:hypothetical protein